MKFRKVICTLLCCLLLLGLSPAASAAGLNAAIAAGPVVLNGVTIDNATAEYPLLVYKDITYFPMTYHLCRFLGLTTRWDAGTKTLSIAKTGELGEYVPDTGHSRKSGSVSVTRVDYPVVVNGTPVDNSTAEWPLVNYNNVTYFPLTWAFAVDAFGWDYHWDAEYGLNINSTGLTVWESTNAASRAWASLATVTPPVIEFNLSGSWTMENIQEAIADNLRAALRSDPSAAESADRLAEIEIDPKFQLPENLQAGQVLTVTYTATYYGDTVLVQGELFVPSAAMAGCTAQITLAAE